MSEDKHHVLGAMRANPNFSLREWAANLEWKYPISGKPDQERVHKAILTLASDGLVMKTGNRWILAKSTKGK